MATTSEDTPVTRWRDVAVILGISHDTLQRRRAACGLRCDRRAPWFPNAAAVRAWWADLIATPARPAPKARKTTRPVPGGAINPRDVARGLVGAK